MSCSVWRNFLCHSETDLIFPLKISVQITHSSHKETYNISWGFKKNHNISKITGTPFDPTFMLSCSVSNVICSIVFGKRYDYKDKKFLALMNNMNNIFKMTNSIWGQVHSAGISQWQHSPRGAGGQNFLMKFHFSLLSRTL